MASALSLFRTGRDVLRFVRTSTWPSGTTMRALLRRIRRTGLHPGTVIDVGVAGGTWELYSEFPDAALLLVEPLKEFEPVLEKIRRTRGAEYVIAAAGPARGEMAINVHPDLAGSSLMHEAEGVAANGSVRIVPIVTLDSICAERRLSGPYVVKIDVQGAELKVLDGAPTVLASTELVILEVSLFQFYVGGPQLYDVLAHMNKQGFVAYDVVGGLRRPLDGALAQLDLAFVRESGVFRNSHHYATPQQRRELEARARRLARIRRWFRWLVR